MVGTNPAGLWVLLLPDPGTPLVLPSRLPPRPPWDILVALETNKASPHHLHRPQLLVAGRGELEGRGTGCGASRGWRERSRASKSSTGGIHSPQDARPREKAAQIRPDRDRASAAQENLGRGQSPPLP